MEKSNEETQKTIKDSVNNTLKDFLATVIESVQEMITNQIDKSSKHMMAGVQEIVSNQAETSNKFMMEVIQTAMQVSTINQQQINTIHFLPSHNTTLQDQPSSNNFSNAVNNEHRQSSSNNLNLTSNATQNEAETLINLTQENRNQPSSDIQLTNTRNRANVDEDDLQWEGMYNTDEESDTDKMEGLEVLSTDEEKATTSNKNRKGSKGIPT